MQEKHTYRTYIKVDELAFFLAHNSRPFECGSDEMGYRIRFKCEPDFLEYAIKERPQFSMINFIDDGIRG